MMYYAYELRSLKDGTHYYGSTSDLEKRLREHNAGKAKYTKGHRPYEVVHSESFSTKKEAATRELYFKSVDGYHWLRANGVLN